MLTSDDVRQLSEANGSLAAGLRRDFAKLMRSLGNPTDPAEIRDALLEWAPVLVHQHQELAYEVAREWYLRQREADGIDAAFDADIDPLTPTDDIQSSVRYHAGSLWDGGPSAMTAAIGGALTMWLWNASRTTIGESATYDPVGYVRTMRVTMGLKTCAFCRLQATRRPQDSWVALDAGWHPDCQCQIVPVFDEEQDYVIGLTRPEVLEIPFGKARAVAVGAGTTALLEAARRLYPSLFTDGVKDQAWLDEHAPGWEEPAETL